MTTNYVKIFDTTLRDGEQSPGATMTSAEKLEVARTLAKLGVDIIEAGFPAASPDDLEAVQRIAREVGNPSDGSKAPIICGLARATKNDIDKAWEAVREAQASAHSHFPRHVRDSHAVQAQDGSRAGGGTRDRDGELTRAACAPMSSSAPKMPAAAIPNSCTSCWSKRSKRARPR